MSIFRRRGSSILGGSGGSTTPTFNNQKSIVFDGINDQIRVPYSATLDPAQYSAFSISAWFKTSTTGLGALVSSYTIPNSEQYILAVRGDSTGFISFYTHDGNSLDEYRTNNTGFDDGNWHHIVMAWSSNSAPIITIDNVVQAGGYNSGGPIASFGSNADSRETLFGAANATGIGNLYTGNIEDISIWSKSLSSDEVSEIYTGNAASVLTSHSASANLVGWWKMGDGDTFPTIQDSSTNTNSGTMVGMLSNDIVNDVP